MIKLLSTVALATLVGSAAGAVTSITVEAAGVQSTTVTAFYLAVENFDSQPRGTVVPVNTSFASIDVAATFTQTRVLAADQYGGAGGVGNQVAVRATGDLDIVFTGKPLTYFGVWASALDANNTVSFFKEGVQLSSTNLTAFALSNAYNGNPTAAFLTQNSREKYAFFNFFVSEGYDEIKLSQNGGGGFELDNVTIGTEVPEPATWALMVVGFGLVGAGLRRRAPRAVAA